MKFFKVCGAVLTLVLVGVGVAVLYDTFTSGVPSTTGGVLVGAVACSLALILFFFIVQPSSK
jgi:hypothetical protein